MLEVNHKSTHKELLLFIQSLTRYEVAAIAVVLNNLYGANIPSYISKNEMIGFFKDAEKEDLLEALAAVCGSDECDEDEEDDEDDEEEEEGEEEGEEEEGEEDEEDEGEDDDAD